MIARPDLRCPSLDCKNPIIEMKDDKGVSDYWCRLHGMVNPARISETPQFQPIPGWESARP